MTGLAVYQNKNYRIVMPKYTLSVNGKSMSVETDADTPVLWVLRDHLNILGPKFGCGMAMCGACTVHVNGSPTRACVTPLAQVAGKRVDTIDGLKSKALAAVQKAWVELDVVQCGYCQSGQIMAAAALLEKTAKPTDADIDSAMNGNLCRCGAYRNILKAGRLAADAQLVQVGDTAGSLTIE
jgi:aerobic-type carbon monoxide dehydrogenase small subunit (CoxS/CutS family)